MANPATANCVINEWNESVGEEKVKAFTTAVSETGS